jgi:hypothetical protein
MASLLSPWVDYYGSVLATAVASYELARDLPRNTLCPSHLKPERGRQRLCGPPRSLLSPTLCPSTRLIDLTLLPTRCPSERCSRR